MKVKVIEVIWKIEMVGMETASVQLETEDGCKTVETVQVRNILERLMAEGWNVQMPTKMGRYCRG